ncbi:hypothetical protein PsorP6_017608 [Peronosclerospora sorghi]|uniref:Uncharacterized protein n=1 Tax=Peronosclerospora sorghi TaxID=230839 RepID=A0ACC0WL35_9STRA|nr:hypothetical protein PsorP6_017608 [Peronosclerospora sorghi]
MPSPSSPAALLGLSPRPKRSSYLDVATTLFHRKRALRRAPSTLRANVVPPRRPCVSTACPSAPPSSPSTRSPLAPLARSCPYPSTKVASVHVASTSARPPPRFRLADVLSHEIVGRHGPPSPRDGVPHARVAHFVLVPLHTEKLFLFGVLVAADSFLAVVTYLPLRLVGGLWSCSHTRGCEPTHFYDCLDALLLAVGTLLLTCVDMSRVYHAIRGQAMIKLYVLSTMIEIFDRLFSSLGQDILDALYDTTPAAPPRRRVLAFLVASLYVVLHALLLLAQVVTLNVAVNSSNSSLLTLLLSNNFAELKTLVFKKFEPPQLFQIACSDILERFKLLTSSGLILLQSSNSDVVYGTALVWLAEMLIDWIKHAFLTKFNRIPPTMYSKFLTILCRDLTGWTTQDTTVDHTHHVAKRLGLMSLPLGCVVLRLVAKALADAPLALTSLSGILCLLTAFLCLVALKVLLSLGLMLYACKSGRLDKRRPHPST